MSIDLTPLIQLHHVDQQIGGLQQSISRIPLQMEEVDRKIDRFNRNLQEKQKQIADNQKKRKELEGDLALIETKRTRYREQLDGVKTNKEYLALQSEIEGVTLGIRQIEDQILAQMEEAEQLKRQLDEIQHAKDREETVLLEEKKMIQAEANRLQEQLDHLKEQRQNWVAKVQPSILAVYDRTARHRRGIAMAEARDELCQECQMRIRPQLYQAIKKNDTIITCESCSRILFYIPPAPAESRETYTGAPS